MLNSREGIFRWAVVMALAGLWLGGVSGAQVRGSETGHDGHGTPTGWRFSWPGGDAGRGRDVFTRYECFSCHEVRGERFPIPRDALSIGPELASIGPVHEVEYFVEAIINPNAVVERGKGYDAADGSSKMPSFNDTLTVQELVDLVTYLKGLRPPPSPPGATGGQGTHATP